MSVVKVTSYYPAKGAPNGEGEGPNNGRQSLQMAQQWPRPEGLAKVYQLCYLPNVTIYNGRVTLTTKNRSGVFRANLTTENRQVVPVTSAINHAHDPVATNGDMVFLAVKVEFSNIGAFLKANLDAPIPLPRWIQQEYPYGNWTVENDWPSEIPILMANREKSLRPFWRYRNTDYRQDQ
ncbi:unnamed protein product [Bursaphelenchus okinawaensis]|uniref:Uncharacterized protein n=1 Tax=Bursaphelenchus okinawaensis TaxID=465554 RepID=A0A811KQY9_9BILA|nr:unnamed protein product [Bursaphelenchus okinawaensis]CAG9109537.1 unnamed protein product [Bursaphelenchus okinawaensis]